MLRFHIAWFWSSFEWTRFAWAVLTPPIHAGRGLDRFGT